MKEVKRTSNTVTKPPPNKDFQLFLLLSSFFWLWLPLLFYFVMTLPYRNFPFIKNPVTQLGIISDFGMILMGALVIGLLIIAFFLFIGGIVSLVSKGKQWKYLLGWSMVMVLSSFILIFSFVSSAFLFRERVFVSLAKRSKPLISAIEQYKRDNGEYPNKLEDLVPKYLSRVPNTKIPAYPEYYYRKASLESCFNKYQLLVPCSTGALNWDVFFYWPEGNYPDSIYGGGVDRIEDWAYVNE